MNRRPVPQRSGPFHHWPKKSRGGPHGPGRSPSRGQPMRARPATNSIARRRSWAKVPATERKTIISTTSAPTGVICAVMCPRSVRAVRPSMNTDARTSSGVSRASTCLASPPTIRATAQPSDWSTTTAPSGATRAPRTSAWPGPHQRSRASRPVSASPGPGRPEPTACDSAAETAPDFPFSGWINVTAPGSTSVTETAPASIGNSPSKGVFATSLATHPLPPGVERHRAGHLAERALTPQRVDRDDALAVPRPAVLQKPERQYLPERRRVAGRGHIAFVGLPHRLGPLREEMRAGRNRLRRARGPQPHEFLAVLQKPGPRRRRPADEVLLRRHHGAHPDIEGRHPAVDLGMGDEPLLDPHDVQRLHPVGTAAQRFGLRDEQPEEALAVARRHRDLVAGLARKRDPEEPGRPSPPPRRSP